MRRSFIFMVLAALSLSATLSGIALGDAGNAQAAPGKESELRTIEDLKNEIRALRQRVAELEALKPTFTNFMPNFSERFHVMHRAGDVGDWAVAVHEVSEMQRLTRISKNIDPKLGGLMAGFMDGNLRKLKEAIDHGSAKSFQAALNDTVTSCNGCHTATGSTILVSVDVDDTLSMRHPHALRKSKVQKEHTHTH